MQLVDSDALGVVNRALGISGAGASETELTDGILEQVVDVAPIIRRGRTIQPSEGIFYGVMENVHPAAGVLSSLINPYKPEVALRHAPYPAIVSPRFDIWLLYATVVRTLGTGTATATLSLRFDGQTQGWGVDNLGAAVTAVPRHPLAFWNTVRSPTDIEFLTLADTQPAVKLGYRFPRVGSPDLVFLTEVTALATYQLGLVMGLFPVSLGQDGMVGGL